jgi:hypothetical protein
MKIQSPLPEWFTPAIHMTLEQIARENPKLIIDLAEAGTLRQHLVEKTNEKLKEYRQKMTEAIDSGDNSGAADITIANDIFGEAVR